MKVPLLRRIAFFIGFLDPFFDYPKIPKEIIKNALPFKKLQQRGPDGEELGPAPNREWPYIGDGEKLSYAPNSYVPYTGWVTRRMRSPHGGGEE